ncbi:MAG: ABC transporter permease subunit, partial [Rickettsiales bacterium]
MEPAEIAAAPRARSGRARIIRADVWTVGAVIVAFIVAMPLISVIGLALTPESEVWGHLIDTVFWGYVGNTLALGAGVSVGTLAIGLPTAWLVTMCRFPGHRLFEWARLVPLAVPAYVIAYTYTDILEYAGPVQGALREVFNWTSAADYYFPEIRSLFGATLMFSLVLYPYIYLLARAAFLAQSVAVLEVSRTLGRTAWGAFWSVALPMARPALVVGLALVLMETLNDFGTVEYFAVPT